MRARPEGALLPEYDRQDRRRRQQPQQHPARAVGVGAEEEVGQNGELVRQREADGGAAPHPPLVLADHPHGGPQHAVGHHREPRGQPRRQGREPEGRPLPVPLPGGPAADREPPHHPGEEEEELQVDRIEEEGHPRQRQPRPPPERPLEQPVRHRRPAERQGEGEQVVHEPPVEDRVVGERQRQQRVPPGPAGAAAEGERRQPHREQGGRDDQLPRHLDRHHPGEPRRQQLEEAVRRPQRQLVGLPEAPDGVGVEAQDRRQGELLRIVHHRRERHHPERQHPERRGGEGEAGTHRGRAHSEAPGPASSSPDSSSAPASAWPGWPVGLT